MKRVVLALTIVVHVLAVLRRRMLKSELNAAAAFHLPESSQKNPTRRRPMKSFAKMGKDTGTNTWDHATKSENDTKKVEQPDRGNTPRNPQ